MDLKEYYADLLILQYRSKPRARAHIKALAGIASLDELPSILKNAFNIEEAVGLQLNILGKYAGVSREGYVNSLFTVLGDDDFRSLIKLAVVKNNSGSSLYDIQQLLFDFFGNKIFVKDFRTMRIGFLVDTSLGGINFISLAISQGLLPIPMGVGFGSIIYSNDVDSFFGFRTYSINTANNTPFNNYSNYEQNWPWLSYSDAITI